MLEISNDVVDITQGIGLTALLAYIHFLILRNLVVYIFDPLVYIAVFSVFSLSLGGIVMPLAQFWIQIAGFAIFWGALYVTAPAARRLPSRGVAALPAPAALSHFQLTIHLSIALVLLANCLLWLQAGVPALSDDPTLAKSELVTGGLGFVRRINWGLAIYALFGSILMLMTTRRIQWLLAVGILSGVSMLGGSKGALLPLLYALALSLSHTSVGIRPETRRRALRWGLLLAPVAAFAALAILLIEAGGSLSLAAQGLVIRLFFFGDITLYWQDDQIRTHFMRQFTAADYPMHLLNPVIALFRLVPFDVPIGNQIVVHSLGFGEDLGGVLGPNTPFYVKGQLFFGMAGMLIYAATVGLVVGLIRRRFSVTSFSSPTEFAAWGTILILSIAAPIEDALFISTVVDFGLAFLLVTAGIAVLKQASLVGRAVSNPSAMSS